MPESQTTHSEEEQHPGIVIPDNQSGLPQNTLGNIIGVDIISRSIRQTNSIVERTAEIEEELFELPFHLQNLNWAQLCRAQNNVLKLAGGNFQPELSEDQILFTETTTYSDKTRLITSDPSHLIPHIPNSDVFQIITSNDRQINVKGITIMQRKANMGLIVYTTFAPGKKIVGLSIYNSDIMQFYYVGNVKTDSIVPNISIPEALAPRDLGSRITDADKVLVANTSQRFRNKVNDWETLRDAVAYLNSLILQTVDPAYIYKLMLLNKALSFPRP